MRKRIIAIAAAVAIAASAAAYAAIPAGASTPGCTQGVYAGYCGTQVSAEAVPLAWDVYRTLAKAGNKIIAYPDNAGDEATDFIWLRYQDGSSDIAEYAPQGVASNLCVTEPGKGDGLVLEACTGDSNQQFTSAEEDTGYTWTVKATGDIVTDPAGLRSQLAGIAPPETLTGADEWTFAG
ncbi:MAG: hypothetical protein ACRDOL_22570 [Streptosporangiaceae bacterium]